MKLSLALSKILTPLKLSVLFGFGCFSLHASAHGKDLNVHDNASVRLFSTYESNGNDFIEGIGVGLTFKGANSGLGFQLNTSFNNAEVRATDGYIEDYFAWQGSVKMGLFSKVSLYVEAGVDLTELIFHDFRHDDHDYYDEYDHGHYEDDIDVFVGVGAGLQLGKLKVEGFSRLREIDSRYWEAESEVFTGVQFSFNF